MSGHSPARMRGKLPSPDQSTVQPGAELTEATVKTALLSELKSRTEPSENCICRLSDETVARFSGE